ncbi:MAG: molybdenum cofactor biosynthesis protein MoaE [Parvularculales bacterium]
MIYIQRDVFNVQEALSSITEGRCDIGGIGLFMGVVRDMNAGRPITQMVLEHYPGMTEKTLARMEAEARQRWVLDDCLIIHRYGLLTLGDPIVLIITAAKQRQPAIEACAFLADTLKVQAPFWKQESDGEHKRWVDSRPEDHAAAERWEKP